MSKAFVPLPAGSNVKSGQWENFHRLEIIIGGDRRKS